MRTLLIDIGNTNLKWSWLQSGERSPLEQAGYQADGVATQALHYWSHAEKPEQVVVANVAGQQVEDELQQWIDSEWGIAIELVTASAQQLGVRNGYTRPEQLGVDRWLALLAAHADKSRRAPVCIVDCGTAITIDVLAEDGQHQGGLILPGLTMMRQVMLDRTQIPRIDLSDHIDLLAKDTASAIAAGGRHAAAALVERVAQQMSPPPKILLTGGDAARLYTAMKLKAEIDPELVMRGLALVAQSE
ncbi:MAG: type III pantothenate kinase [Candidatus Polarisedimenticolaceae bacterium]|nr:type III pantothenate kinase [Candidatus Polarisedimenticolaceae bacterium]